MLIHQIDPNDNDCDGVVNNEDNCPDTPNGLEGGTCTAGATYTIGRPCTINADCGDSGFCSTNQEDTDPSGGDGIGDACSICEADFDCDKDVDGSDAPLFKNDFGRRNFNNPCESGNPCNGDFDCDGDCDGTDVATFKEDFGRNSFNHPCPACVEGEWCVYQ